MKRLLIVSGFAFNLALCVFAQTQKRDVDIKGADGVNLKATYYSPGRSGPGMLLLHQCNMDRHAWDGLAQDLANAGFHVVTLDFRGYGESGGERSQRDKWPGDADAAYSYLISQKEVDKSRIAAGGASCGVTQSSDLAARHHEIKALMLLSGQASDAAKTYISTTPSLPVFGAASAGDTGAAQGIKDAVGASKNPQSTVKIYAGTEHGVPMFAKNPELEPFIVTWLKTQLAVKTSSR
ncbi:MAG TPA: alpha/beta fold hydrolase [Bryobacteraceae bacterium]|nr:alpha/beta fold hydrolase [Bryobacteraceae bacterium]